MTRGGVCERGSEDLAMAASRADDRAGIIVELEARLIGFPPDDRPVFDQENLVSFSFAACGGVVLGVCWFRRDVGVGMTPVEDRQHA